MNKPSPTQVLVFGILSLALCESAILGLIFGILARNNAKAFKAATTEISSQVNTGEKLGTVGMILSIIAIVFWVIFAIIMIIVAVAAKSQGYY